MSIKDDGRHKCPPCCLLFSASVCPNISAMSSMNPVILSTVRALCSRWSSHWPADLEECVCADVLTDCWHLWENKLQQAPLREFTAVGASSCIISTHGNQKWKADLIFPPNMFSVMNVYSPPPAARWSYDRASNRTQDLQVLSSLQTKFQSERENLSSSWRSKMVARYVNNGTTITSRRLFAMLACFGEVKMSWLKSFAHKLPYSVLWLAGISKQWRSTKAFLEVSIFLFWLFTNRKSINPNVMSFPAASPMNEIMGWTN